MKTLFQQITALLLASLLMFSTLSFRVDMHFCGEHLVDFSFTSNAVGCAMLNDAPETPGVCIMAAMDCCTDLEIVVQGQEDLPQKGDPLAVDDNPPPVLAPTTTHYLWPVSVASRYRQPFKEYPPPVPHRKAHLLYETFLI